MGKIRIKERWECMIVVFFLAAARVVSERDYHLACKFGKWLKFHFNLVFRIIQINTENYKP